MATKRIINIFDLGPGDGGKGGVVHKYATEYRAHTILKFGGAQGSHGVCVGDRKFAFSQWGCGTFENIPTHITEGFVACPDALLSEANALVKLGVSDPFNLLTVAGSAVCSTPYHGFVSRIKELSLRDNPRGTIGSGVGQAVRLNKTNPELTIRFDDFKNMDVLYGKLKKIKTHECDLITSTVSLNDILPNDLMEYHNELNILIDSDFIEFLMDAYKKLGKLINIVDDREQLKKIFDLDGVAVVENSHGILTDNVIGLNPHTSALRTLPQFVRHFLLNAGYKEDIKHIGVHRAYSIRHGAGPLPTHDPSMNEQLLPGSNKDENRYQGKVRVGPLDFILLQYALGYVTDIDGLAITWFDQIAKNGFWNICDEYSGFDFKEFQSRENSELVKLLNNAVPVIKKIELPKSVYEQFDLCYSLMSEKLKVPVDLVSFGPTDQHKILKGLLNV
jgi:adenylosuccinate synthase